MKKTFNYILLCMIMLIPLSIKAINVDEIDMSIYVDNNGTAHVSETWNDPVADSDSTEFYKSYKNLDNMKITNFKVSYNNQSFQYYDDWNIDNSFEEKSYKNGLYYEDDATELCWGISDYNSGTYVLNYDIEGFIVGLKDSDMIYFNFLPKGNQINNFHLKLYSDNKFSNKVPVWGYGRKNGTAYVSDGYIEMNSEGSITSDQYVTLLAKFDKGSYKTTNTKKEDFSYYEKLAKKGSSTSIKSNSVYKIISNIFSFLSRFIFVIIMFFIGMFVALKSKNKIGTYIYDFGKDKRKLPKKVNNIRDIPFNDIYKVYLYSYVYFLLNKQTDFLGAILLKWLKEKKITIKQIESRILKKDQSVIVFNSDLIFDNKYEQKMYDMMYEASNDGILESKEFERWCKINYDKILRWFDDVLDYATENLMLEGLVTKIPNQTKLQITDKFKEEAIKVKGVKQFLIEFSRIDDKSAIEVNLWEYYLIYAQIFGIADKISRQFKKLYPDYIESYNERYGYGINDIIFINMISSSGMSSAMSSRDKAQNYSAGGGGFMSGGGGGGSFGGGGSMGSR